MGRVKFVVPVIFTQQLRANDLKNIAVGAAMAHRSTGLFGFGIFARLAHQGPQLLAVGARAKRDPLPQRFVFIDQAITPYLGLVQGLGFKRRRRVLLDQGGTNTVELRGLEFAHELADELHLAALALKITDAFGFSHGFCQFFRQSQTRH